MENVKIDFSGSLTESFAVPMTDIACSSDLYQFLLIFCNRLKGVFKIDAFIIYTSLSSEDIVRLRCILNEKFEGLPLKDITQAFIQTTALSFGELSLFMPNVLLAIRDAAKDASLVSVAESGMTKLLFVNDLDMMAARDIIKFLSDKNDVATLLTSVNGTKVYLGGESGKYQLDKAGIVVSRYTLGGAFAGAVAVIGPQRMNYKDIVSVTEYVAEKSGELINELLEAG